MATLNDVISCYNELVDEVNGHTASIDKLNARIEDVATANVSAIQTVETAMASLTAKLSQLEARLDELVQEHDVMMDTISSLLAAPTQTAVSEEGTVELKRVEKKTVEEQPAPTPTVELKRVEKKEEEKTPTVAFQGDSTPAPKRAPAPAPETVVEEEPAPTVELKRTPAPAPKRAPAPKTTVTEIQKRAFARQYMVEHGAKVEDLRNPERINETIASDEFTAWMNAR